MAVFHYLCLHESPYFRNKHDGRILPNGNKYEKCLIRLPIWVDMSFSQVEFVITKVLDFFNINRIEN